MAKILMIEDQHNKAIRRMQALKEAGHDVIPIVCERLNEFITDAKNALANQHFDVLLLDLNLKGDQWGGVTLYNWLRQSAFRNHWDHTIITTMYKSGPDPRRYDVSSPDAFILKIFAETAMIPTENVLPATHGQEGQNALEILIERIKQLVPNQRPVRCQSCGERQV